MHYWWRPLINSRKNLVKSEYRDLNVQDRRISEFESAPEAKVKNVDRLSYLEQDLETRDSLLDHRENWFRLGITLESKEREKDFL